MGCSSSAVLIIAKQKGKEEAEEDDRGNSYFPKQESDGEVDHKSGM